MVEHPLQDVPAPETFVRRAGVWVDQGADDLPAERGLLMVFAARSLQSAFLLSKWGTDRVPERTNADHDKVCW